MEAIAPVDLLRRAGADVVTVGIGGRQITGSHNITISTDITDDEMRREGLEMIVLPGGGGGTAAIMGCDAVKNMVRYAYDNGLWVCAICAAPTVLGSMGLLKGRKAVCYPGNEHLLTGAEIVDADVVTDGRIITGRAAGAATPFALKLAEALKGPGESESVREKICYR
jgi:4-methyl-5(b-hydroxyethyl)-thiazole monophosphate biosynthesis